MARTDNDTSDLASSVGATATMVAAQRALSNREGLIDDPFAEPLVRAVGLDFFTRALDGEIELEDVDPEFNMRRAAEGMAVRTRWFDKLFTDAAAAGVRQAVILAAGLDARAYRLPWPDGTTVYELDQPAVIEFKTETLAGLSAKPKADRRAVAIDLRYNWPKALLDNGFDATQPTAWIAEGLLIYLPPDAQDRLFDNITALSAPGSRLATEHMDIQGSPDEWTEKLDERSRRMGSNIRLADLFYTGERNSAGDYLTSKAWDVTIRSTREAYAVNGFELPEDELIDLAGDSGYLSAILK